MYKGIKDQLGDPVPEDLVVLDIPADLLGAETCRNIDYLNWYEYQGLILISGSAVNWLTETDPLDCGVSLDGVKEITLIPWSLHRHDRLSGAWYHA